MGNFKEIKMYFNYKLALEIIEIFRGSKENIEDSLNTMLWIDDIDVKYFIINKILKNDIMCLYEPNKHTILHTFIGNYLYFYVKNDRYYLLDSLFEDLESEPIIEFFDKYIKIFQDYNVDIKKYENDIKLILEELDEKYQKEIDVENNYLMLIEDKIKYNFDCIVENFDNIQEEIVNSVFYLLFSNKDFLFDFNKFISNYIDSKLLNEDSIFSNGNIKRRKNLPKWLEKAVLYRDNGICQKCGTDLSGINKITDDREKQYDHIIPLSRRGTNDPTNFQLLCSKCNNTKKNTIQKNKHFYQMYW